VSLEVVWFWRRL